MSISAKLTLPTTLKYGFHQAAKLQDEIIEHCVRYDLVYLLLLDKDSDWKAIHENKLEALIKRSQTLPNTKAIKECEESMNEATAKLSASKEVFFTISTKLMAAHSNADNLEETEKNARISSLTREAYTLHQEIDSFEVLIGSNKAKLLNLKNHQCNPLCVFYHQHPVQDIHNYAL